MKKNYQAPILVEHGSIPVLTAAIGGGGMDDQSDYPEQFPANGGSFDVCDNDNPNSVC